MRRAENRGCMEITHEVGQGPEGAVAPYINGWMD